MTHPGAVFAYIGRWLKSAARPLPSPELKELREATDRVEAAADHLKKTALSVGRAALRMRQDPRKRKPAEKKATTK